MERALEKPVGIDLSSFKMHVRMRPGRTLSLHFNTPSRRFYLSLIAFLAARMRRSGRVGSVPLRDALQSHLACHPLS